MMIDLKLLRGRIASLCLLGAISLPVALLASPQQTSIGVGGGAVAGGPVGRFSLTHAVLPDREVLLKLNTVTGEASVAEGREWRLFAGRVGDVGVPASAGQFAMTVAAGPAASVVYLLNTRTGETFVLEGTTWEVFEQKH